MFQTTLHVAHAEGRHWHLTRPLIWRGRWEFFIIREGFVTDFASIPKPVRWLLDNAGRNSEAAVLHDAVWRESQRPVAERRIDPWHADGVFRRALRQTGSTALSRGLMWFAVRSRAILSGRFGRLGPSPIVKVLQLIGMFLVGAVTVLGPTIVAVAGLLVYWVASWIVAGVWHLFERARLHEPTNWPWPYNSGAPERAGEDEDRLLVVPEKDMPSELLGMLTEGLDITESVIEHFFPGALVEGDLLP